MKRVVLSMLAVSAILFTSCSDDNENVEPTVEAPATYTFERGGNSTVSFTGQTIRIKMAEKLITAMKDNSKTEVELDSMFARKLTTHTYFNDPILDGSDKNVRSKVAASYDYFNQNSTEANEIKATLDGYIAKQVSEVFPNWNVDAVAGTAGKIQQAGGGTTRYVNAKGLEYNQALAKSLIGALMMDQMLNNYLSTTVLDGVNNINRKNNDADVLSDGKNYTEMEHKWDEAYGYLYGNEADPASPTLDVDPFLSEYVLKVDEDADFKGIAKDIFEAFKLGRAAIVAKDYQLRDKQIAIIKEAISKVIAIRGVFYIQKGKDLVTSADKASMFHSLSEGYGFIYSLRFSQNPQGTPYLSTTDIKGFLDTLENGNGFWDVKEADLDNISTKIATAFGFTVNQVK
ncbi:DUF4856 domain-containing protein [Tenacibaculum sp. TC6]|uniref:DUF4856 domain-containing protein n=1 Tax=Tenacibaculum sp. TC6 TaxID=3423223 RepID=UPI003D359CC5